MGELVEGRKMMIPLSSFESILLKRIQDEMANYLASASEVNFLSNCVRCVRELEDLRGKFKELKDFVDHKE